MKLQDQIALIALCAFVLSPGGASAIDAAAKSKPGKAASTAAPRTQSNISGNYTIGGQGSDYVRIRAGKDGTYSASIYGTFLHNSGGSDGTFRVTGGFAVFSPDGCPRCEFLLCFKNPKLMLMQECDNEFLCGMGHGVYATAVYSKVRNSNRTSICNRPW